MGLEAKACRAGERDGELRDEELGAVLHQHGDDLFWPRAGFVEPGTEERRLLNQLYICARRVLIDHGNGIRSERCARLDHLVDVCEGVGRW